MTHTTTRDASRRPIIMPAQTRSAADWKPEPCLLTRDEIRRIILEQLG